MHTSTRTASLLLAAAAASVGIGLAVAAPAMAIPTDPLLPPNPFNAHDQVLTRLQDREVPGNPIRVVTGNFDRFNERFGGGQGTG